MEFERIANGVWKLRIGEPERHTPVALRAFPMREEALEKMSAAVLPDVASQITFRHSARGLQIMLPMDCGEDIYGLGLQLLSMNQAGRKRLLRVNSDPAADTGEGHAPVPFYVSTGGYGLLVDTFRHVEYYMGTNLEKGRSCRQREVNREHRELTESALFAMRKRAERRTIIIDLKAVDGVDLYLFAGNVKEAVGRYNLFSGGGCLPPMWGLGVWYRAYGGSDQEAVEKMAEDFRAERMPVDVLGLEPGWHSHSYSCTYQWSYLFPRHQEMIEKLNRKDYKINLWEHLFVYPAASFYQEMQPYAGEYEVWNGLVPDFALPEARKLFADYHRENFVEKGIAGFKLDECDNSDFNAANWSFPDAAQFPSGMDGEQMHGAIGGMYQNLIYGIYREENRRTYSQVRSGGALAAPLPFVLYSDLYQHRQFIRGVVTAGFSGLLWAPEVRDCKNGVDLLRRMETILFSAHAIYNCWQIPNPPWKQVDIEKNLAGEFMEDADYYTDVCRRWHRVRMSLLPYLYSAFVKYQREGIPPVRALVFDYQEDLAVRNVDDEYIFGDDLLVAPMTLEDGKERRVYLPRGKWHDFWGDAVYEGGREHVIFADYDKIPVFVRENCILPLAEPVEAVGSDTVFTIHPKVYGSGGDGCVLYEDDFETFAYEQGAQNTVRIFRNAAGQIELHREGTQPQRYVVAAEESMHQ
ncbi:MAG: glycoside hydrolase [Lachnospiraceae bacterium]|nr:glycoside hydrolase [Lachnospiraceae bacterium]